MNGISHLFFQGKLRSVRDSPRYFRSACKRAVSRVASTALTADRSTKSDEAPSLAELAALDELKRKFLLDKASAGFCRMSPWNRP